MGFDGEKDTSEIEEVEILQEVSPIALYQQDKAAVDVQIATAKAYPRNIRRATENALAIATMDRETAETCNYSLPRGGKTVQGPSVHLAKIIAQQWGNMRIDAKVVSIDAKHVTSDSVCWDLETNLAIRVQVKRSIMQNEKVWSNEANKMVATGRTVRMNDDMITMTGNAGNAIALRNSIYAVIPKSVVDKIYKEAKAKITGDVSDKTKLIARRKQVVDGLMDSYGVTQKEILNSIGRASIDHVTADDIVVLVGIGTAIKNGDTSIEEVFKQQKTASNGEKVLNQEDLQELFDLKKEFLTSDEVKNGERILEKKEEKSYLKLQKLLQAK